MNFTEWPNPDSWMDVVNHLIIAVFMLLITVIPLRNGKAIKDIKNQVVNGHTSPLRADLDKAIQAIDLLKDDVASFRHAITRDVNGLHSALADEEDRRRQSVSDIRKYYDRRIENINHRLEDQ
jgi:hypothetical protein